MDLKSEVKKVILSSLKESFDINIGIEIENIIYNDKNEELQEFTIILSFLSL